MLLDDLEKISDFSNAESELARFLLDNPDQINDLTALKLGKLTYTSKSTVLRFCKKIGFSGFTDFKKRFIIETVEQQRVLEVSKKRPVNQDTEIKNLSTSIMSIYNEALTITRLQIEPTILESTLQKLATMSLIDIYGNGIAESCGVAAAFKFRTLGYNSSEQTNINEHFIAVTKNQRNRAAILLSFTGGNSAIIEFANYLKGQDFYLIGIGGNSDDSLSQLVDVYFKVPSTSNLNSLEVVSEMAAINYVLDLLFSGLTVINYSSVVKSSADLIERR